MTSWWRAKCHRQRWCTAHRHPCCKRPTQQQDADEMAWAALAPVKGFPAKRDT